MLNERMFLRRKLEARLADQQKKVAELERLLLEARAYLSGMQDSLKLLPQELDVRAPSPTLREGSDLAKARDALRNEGKPLHVDEILKRMGKDATRNTKGALGGSLSGYVRKGLIFTKAGPNIFGLREFESRQTDEQPPEEFGLNGGEE